jgi:hypothetical protein
MTSGRRTLRLAALAAGLLSLASCSEARSDAQRTLPLREPYIALERDFQDFESWPVVDLSVRPALSNNHEGGDAREYINQRPVRGAKAFPVGTILVKTVEHPAKDKDGKLLEGTKQKDVFAMVKRGGGYNGAGAPGWEWIELRRREDDTFGIVWRGLNPPAGEGYGSEKEGGCNGCHQMAIKNDYVHAAVLQLSKL